ncbi:serine/threonine protein kinase [Streptomyces sp. NPDC050617]|uniref:serine/threonine protein kinase n=1 Tax=Streptomyces sp. NPDC050617 TaxID=3154628 RepID=UPI0034414725
MTAPRRGVPRCVGPYAVLARLDGEGSRLPVPERRFIARSADGERTVLAGVPHEDADPRRFATEAQASRYLLGPYCAPAVEFSSPGEPPWHARPYLPALPLPTAVAVNGAPLPEHTVRALGAALAESLAVTHGQGLTHAGVSPAAVLLAADGPRLTCFGAVRAAAEEGAPRAGAPGLEPGSLPPEQAVGGTPDPLGDSYALGATLAYAATGHTAPERDELPPGLRRVIRACLSRDPASRPRAADLLDEFIRDADAASVPSGAGGGRSDAVPAHPRTVIDRSDAARAAVTLGPGWLPGRVVAAIARQSAVILAADLPAAAPPAPAHRQD